MPTKRPETAEKKPKKEKPKKLATKCLLLKTPDNRCFFTEEKHFPCLIEFGRTFDADISVVKTKEQVEVLDLTDLAKAICNPEATNPPEYEVVETKMAAPQKKSNQSRVARAERGREVLAFASARVLSGAEISVTDLVSKFPDVAKTRLVQHFTRARRDLAAKGHTLKRTKPGTYQLAQSKT